MKNFPAFALAFLLCQSFTRADIIITEVYSAGSGNGTYGADWFELTNTGTTLVDITGWKMDDNSNSSAASVELRGVTSIAAGQSVVFFEGIASGLPDATIQASFVNAWFGGNAPSGFVIGAYGGTQVGLGTGGDSVNIYNASNILQSSVSFGAATTGRTFDNSGLLNNGTISSLSTVGVNGAFLSFNGAEIGSPGSITAVPEPSSIALLALASGIGFTVRKRSKSRSKQDAVSC